MYIDPSGNMPQWLKWTISIGVILGLGVATLLTLGSTALITGAAAKLVIGSLGGASVGAGLGLISGIRLDENGLSYDWDRAATGVMLGTLTGAISGYLGVKFKAISKFGTFSKQSIMAGIDGTLSLMTYLIQSGIHDDKITLGGALISFGGGLFNYAEPMGHKVFDAIWGPMMGVQIAWAYDTFSSMEEKKRAKLMIPKLYLGGIN